jgi:acyl-coenzyme A thioesterase PaaI-like protein
MPLTWYNRNIVGTHFGGSLYAMVDPFFMAILMERLGPDHVIWDKAAEIRFRRPGRGTVTATFDLDDATVAAILAEAAGGEAVERWFDVAVRGPDGDVVATARKLVHVRRK